MSPRWRSFWFLILAIGFVFLIDRISTQARVDHKQATNKETAQRAVEKRTAQAKAKGPARPMLVPLYPRGDLLVPQTAKADPKAQRPKKVAATVDKKQAPLIPPSLDQDGNRPILEVGYDQIGFTRYLDVIEHVGRFFVLLESEEGSRLGPEVSLSGGFLYADQTDLSRLAINRPHLVTDPKVQDRLSSIDLPTEAFDDRVVLVLTKPFDSLLWDSISESLTEQGFSLDQVGLVTGAYVTGKNGVFLALDRAVIKDDGHRVSLNKRVRVSLL